MVVMGLAQLTDGSEVLVVCGWGRLQAMSSQVSDCVNIGSALRLGSRALMAGHPSSVTLCKGVPAALAWWWQHCRLVRKCKSLVVTLGRSCAPAPPSRASLGPRPRSRERRAGAPRRREASPSDEAFRSRSFSEAGAPMRPPLLQTPPGAALSPSRPQTASCAAVGIPGVRRATGGGGEHARVAASTWRARGIEQSSVSRCAQKWRPRGARPRRRRARACALWE